MDPAFAAHLQYEERKKTLGAAILVWLLLGWLGGHRVYLKSPIGAALAGVVGAVSVLVPAAMAWSGPAAGPYWTLTVPWIIVWLADGFWVMYRVDELNQEVRLEIAMASGPGPYFATPVSNAPRVAMMIACSVATLVLFIVVHTLRKSAQQVDAAMQLMLQEDEAMRQNGAVEAKRALEQLMGPGAAP